MSSKHYRQGYILKAEKNPSPLSIYEREVVDVYFETIQDG